VLAKCAADYATLRSDVAAAGGNVVGEVAELNLLVVTVPNLASKRMIASSPHSAGIARDGLRQLAPGKARPELGRALAGVIGPASDGAILGPDASIGLSVITGDPAFSLAGLMWDVGRIKAPRVWNLPNGLGYQSIKVGVIDTGLDYTHAELAHKVDQVVDFTVNEQPNLCQSSFGLPTDAQLATAFGAPSANLDFNGHGTWIGGVIAAALDGQGINGIAPNVQLVALKVAQNCGSSYDCEILDALVYAANNGLDVVNISLSKYLDRTDPEQNLIYSLYQSAVAYAVARGTVVVAPAGDDHTRIGTGGQVIRHSVLSAPPGGVDRFGQWEVPGGIPHVVNVGATMNVVNSASATCPAESVRPARISGASLPATATSHSASGCRISSPTTATTVCGLPSLRRGARVSSTYPIPTAAVRKAGPGPEQIRLRAGLRRPTALMRGRFSASPPTSRPRSHVSPLLASPASRTTSATRCNREPRWRRHTSRRSSR